MQTHNANEKLVLFAIMSTDYKSLSCAWADIKTLEINHLLPPHSWTHRARHWKISQASMWCEFSHFHSGSLLNNYLPFCLASSASFNLISVAHGNFKSLFYVNSFSITNMRHYAVSYLFIFENNATFITYCHYYFHLAPCIQFLTKCSFSPLKLFEQPVFN